MNPHKMWREDIPETYYKSVYHKPGLDCIIFLCLIQSWWKRLPNSQFVVFCLVSWVWIQSDTPSGELHLEVGNAMCHNSSLKTHSMYKLYGPATF